MHPLASLAYVRPGWVSICAIMGVVVPHMEEDVREGGARLPVATEACPSDCCAWLPVAISTVGRRCHWTTDDDDTHNRVGETL